MLKAYTKSLIKAFVPVTIIEGVWNALSRSQTLRARHAFARSRETPSYLDSHDLEMLHRQFPCPAKESYGYDARSVNRRGRERASWLLRTLRAKGATLATSLELGCGEGAVSRFLRPAGVTTIATDLDASDFDAAAFAAGVRFSRMDARTLALLDESVDVVFSFNSFEHFPNVELCLAEMIRVTKPGGHIYLYFNPLYMAPRGLHAYRRVPIPYCQHLFPGELLDDFIRRNNGGTSDLPWVNRCRLEDYRRLWGRHSHQLETLSYYEILDASGVSLIERFPSCFKSKSDNFDEFLVTAIEALFRKRPEPHS
jgi:SAM-dependent methyltransferase